MNIKYQQQMLGLSLQLDQSLIESMEKTARNHFPNEFGGVLVGKYSEDGRTVFLKNFICPKKYKQSPIFFERETKFINRELKRIYEVSQGQLFYVGEWHTHPNMRPIPSLHDLKSMQKLLAQDIKINNPLLLIIGGTKYDLNIQCYLMHQNKLIKYEASQP